MKCHEDVLAIVEGLKELYPDGLCSQIGRAHV